MRKGRSKSKFVGMRLSEEQSQALEKLQRDSNLNKSDVLLKGLELLNEYYSIGADQRPISQELRSLEGEAVRHTEALKQIKKREEAINQIIQELGDIDKLIDKYKGDEEALIQMLIDVQALDNWLPKPALIWLAERLGIPWSRIYHIATFYKAFSMVPKGRHSVTVCLGTACQVRGAPSLLDRVTSALDIQPGETTGDMRFSLDTVNCLGCCALGPVMEVDGKYYSKPSTTELDKILAAYK
jgi:NADH-quinone oxidoreductase subunit E